MAALLNVLQRAIIPLIAVIATGLLCIAGIEPRWRWLGLMLTVPLVLFSVYLVPPEPEQHPHVVIGGRRRSLPRANSALNCG
ncbi:MAG: hypothetical protein WC782_13990 [Methylococcaceae bacterium]|jgi:hypothetical protein